MKKQIVVAVVLGLLMVASAQAQTTQLFDWPRWRGANGDGVSLETAWNPSALKEAKVLWEVNTGTGFSAIVIRSNRLVTMGLVGSDTVVSCLNATSGELIWKTSIIGAWAPPQSTPTIDDDRVYCVTNNLLFCVSLSSGEVIWKNTDLARGVRPARGMASSPVVEGNLLLINENTEALAFDKMTGDFVWRAYDDLPATSRGSYATPIVCSLDGIRRAVFLGPSSLYMVDLANGQKFWSLAHGDRSYVGADLLTSGNRTFIALTAKCMQLELAASGPKEMWSNSNLTGWVSSPVLLDGYVYGSHMPATSSRQVLDGMKAVMSSYTLYIPTTNFAKALEGIKATSFPFRCIDWSTGKVMWERQMPVVSLMAAGGRLIMQELDGSLHVLEASASGYQELAASAVLRTGSEPRLYATPPVLSSGKLFCKSYGGDLVCIDVSE